MLGVADHDPDGLARSIEIDRSIRWEEVMENRRRKDLHLFLHPSTMPPEQALAKDQRAHAKGARSTMFDQDGFADECDGVCGI